MAHQMQKRKYVELPLWKVKPNSLNPRYEPDARSLRELAKNIEAKGVLEPIVVRGKGQVFEVVVGDRRFKAAKQAGLERIPALVGTYTDEEVIEMGLIENVQRSDLSAVEKAKACKMLRDRFPEKFGTWEKIADAIGVDYETVKQWIRTLGLPEQISEMIAPRVIKQVPRGKIDYQTALHVTEAIKEKPRQLEVVREIVARQIPQRQAQEVIRQAAAQPKMPVDKVISEFAETPLELRLSLDETRAIIKGKKTMMISQFSTRDLEKLRSGREIHISVSEPMVADLRSGGVERKRLGDVTENETKTAGYSSFSAFKSAWVKIHGYWEESELVDLMTFGVIRQRVSDL